jgi:predicted dehydrogenase
MRDAAKEAGTRVFMGFNKNVSAYLERSREYASTQVDEQKCDVTFLHNNAYENSEKELAECFERNAEGMLKNMAIHELALLVSFYDVSVDNIASVEADKKFSSCKTLKGPSSGNNFTDFDKLKFKITTKAGVEVNVAADRCGGDDSVGIISDAATGTELARYTMPDEAAVTNIPNLETSYPNAMPYFFAQDPDYLTLKKRVVEYCITGNEPEGVATIDVAIETLKVAEYLTPLLQDQLK